MADTRLLRGGVIETIGSGTRLLRGGIIASEPVGGVTYDGSAQISAAVSFSLTASLSLAARSTIANLVGVSSIAGIPYTATVTIGTVTGLQSSAIRAVNVVCTIAVDVNAYRVVQAYAPGAETNSGASGYYGMSFKPSVSMQVISLGIRAASGNTGTHTVSLVDYDANQTITDAAVNLTGSTPGNWYYAPVSANQVLSVGKQYLLLAQETNGGQYWADQGAVTLRDATEVQAVYGAALP